jgi:hypothetical protein
VTGDSGSSFERKSFHARRPFRTPKRSTNACATRAERSSSPPPFPKMPPTSDAVAITSVSFQSWTCWPIAAYSPGIFVGSRRASAM